MSTVTNVVGHIRHPRPGIPFKYIGRTMYRFGLGDEGWGNPFTDRNSSDPAEDYDRYLDQHPELLARFWPGQRAGRREGDGVKFEGPCYKCNGEGQIANTERGEPWSQWTELPLESSVAVLMGLVRPVPCPLCGGSGVRRVDAGSDEGL